LDFDLRKTTYSVESWHRGKSIIHQGEFIIDKGENQGALDIKGVQICVCLDLQIFERHTSKIGST